MGGIGQRDEMSWMGGWTDRPSQVTQENAAHESKKEVRRCEEKGT